MEQNDKRLAQSKAGLKLLIDSSAHLCFNEIANATGYHILDLLEHYPKIDYFYSNAMLNELIRGSQGMKSVTTDMFKRSLVNESSGIDQKDNRHLYNSKDGQIKVAFLTKISQVDSGQILLCQNHKDLVLLTNDHRMLKNGGALLDNRIMDVLNLLELMVETPRDNVRKVRVEIKEWFDANYGYKRPKTIRYIEDRKTEPKPPHFYE